MVYSVIRVPTPTSDARRRDEPVLTETDTIHEMSLDGWTYVTATPEPDGARGPQADSRGAQLVIFWREAMVPSHTGRPVGDGSWRTEYPGSTDRLGSAAD